MAVFVDLEDESEPPEVQLELSRQQREMLILNPTLRNRELRGMEGKSVATVEETRANPNRNMITQALGCYP
jgi:hypothetical protein